MDIKQQISILEWFPKIMWHWRLEEWCWKFSAAPQEEITRKTVTLNYSNILKYYYIYCILLSKTIKEYYCTVTCSV